MNRRFRQTLALLSAALLLFVQAVPAFALCPCEMSPERSCCAENDAAAGTGSGLPPAGPASSCCTGESAAGAPLPAAAPADHGSGCCTADSVPGRTADASTPVSVVPVAKLGTPCCEQTTFSAEVSLATVPAESVSGPPASEIPAALPSPSVAPAPAAASAHPERGPPAVAAVPGFVGHTILLL